MERLTCYFDDNTAVLRECCTFDRESETEPDDCISCGELCEEKNNDCSECPISKCFNRLGVYENAQEKIEKRIQQIKANENYPHNFMGQMVDDFEWVLKLLEQ